MADLAQFLRERVADSGSDLRALAERMPYSRSQISRCLSGKVVPHGRFVEALLAATAGKDARTRDTHRRRAEELLAAAQHPKPRSHAVSPEVAVEIVAVQARHLQTYERLTQTLDQRNELREALTRSEKLVFVLSAMMQFLHQRIDTLTLERDVLLGNRETSAAEIQDQLRLARAQETRTREELQRARQRLQRADHLLRYSQVEIERLRRDLERLGTSSASDPQTTTEETPATSGTLPGAPIGVSHNPTTTDIDQALEHAATINAEDNSILDQVADGLTAAPIPEEDELQELLKQLPKDTIAAAAAAALPFAVPHHPNVDVGILIRSLSGRPAPGRLHLIARFNEHAAALAGGDVSAQLQRYNDTLAQRKLITASDIERMRADAAHSSASRKAGMLRRPPRRRPVAKGVTAAALSLSLGLVLSTFAAPGEGHRQGAAPSASPSLPSQQPSSSTAVPLSLGTPVNLTIAMDLHGPQENGQDVTAQKLRPQIPRIEAALKGRRALLVLIFGTAPSPADGQAVSEKLAQLLPGEMNLMRQAQFKTYWQGGNEYGEARLEIYTALGNSLPPSESRGAATAD